jgi:2-polyprenyl-6-methoxyphenol hydroxylase-like FAD-dependent oxidoreductase
MSEAPATTTTCCIAGGGPAGAMLGLLLARAGVDVLVLEKHPDFLRDFRGDTIHASTLRLMDELGMSEEFLRLPHQTSPTLGVSTDHGDFTFADFRRLRGPYRYIAFMPQWDFLDFVVGKARELPGFELRMQAEALEVTRAGDQITGLTYRDHKGQTHRVRAALTVAADGRDSTLRRSAGLTPRRFGAPMDVLWFRLSRRPEEQSQSFGRLTTGHLLVMLDRGTYWQIGFLVPKGGYDDVRAAGMEAFRAELARLAPFLADRVDELRDWDDVSVLSVQVDRLRRWYRPGFLCIGDAAHAMSPIGGVGINLAIQDAVATANATAGPLLAETLRTAHLARVQLRRMVPTVVTQLAQRAIQRWFLGPLLAGREPMTEAPRALRVLRRVPVLQGVPARLVGIGLMPEHVRPPTASHGPHHP